MSDKTGIEWTDATWNPIRGCSRVSEGCRNCYAETVANRFKGPGQPYEGLIARGGQWNGKITVVDHLMDWPLRKKKPMRIFVNSMSDLFHENVPDEVIDQIFAVMACAYWHTFQVLTKRPERMLQYLRGHAAGGRHIWTAGQQIKMPRGLHKPDTGWPLPNVWLGVSVEDQKTANERIPLLLDTPAAVRWISAEPLLGPIDLNRLYGEQEHPSGAFEQWWSSCLSGKKFDPWSDGDIAIPKLDWVVVGGESGPHARPMHPAWARSLRDQCAAAGVPFLFKQWGEWSPEDPGEGPGIYRDTAGVLPDGSFLRYSEGYVAPFDTMERLRAAGGVRRDGRFLMHNVGKKRAGRLLDGLLHDGYPEMRA